MSRMERSHFPITQAFTFALQGMRLRMGRMLLVLAGVAVAIAFTNVLLTTNFLFESMAAKQAAASVSVNAAGAQGLKSVFRYLWMGVALLICTTGTLNAIVMSVTERVKEIGTLKCLGSRNIHIVEIFLFESVLLGLAGGILGGLFGYVLGVLNFVASVGSEWLSFETALMATINILKCVGISAVLSLFASVIPVLMAAKVEPAAAMRYEV
ncbi:MAG: FtsX-like permease family protein [Planctomycetes bacterium]|nr:FtsX-like permease family protein [Planctomycetota bacterium]